METLAERLFLHDRGCHYFQGYLISAPLPPEAWPDLLHRVQTAQASTRAIEGNTAS